jgi:YbbR domain-containing protein
VPADVESSYSAVLQKRDLSLPPSVQLKNILPSEIELIFDNLATKTVPVEVPLLGSVAAGLSLDGVVISPSEVTVSGPESELKGLSVVEGFPIDLKDVKESARKEIRIRVPGKLTEASVSSVTAEVKVSPLQMERKIENIPVELRARNQGNYKIRPLNVDVTVSGPQRLVEDLEPRQILPFVRLLGDLKAGQKVDIEVELPRGVALKNIQPDRITVAEID